MKAAKKISKSNYRRSKSTTPLPDLEKLALEEVEAARRHREDVMHEVVGNRAKSA
jgi:hypothetical protein